MHLENAEYISKSIYNTNLLDLLNRGEGGGGYDG